MVYFSPDGMRTVYENPLHFSLRCHARKTWDEVRLEGRVHVDVNGAAKASIAVCVRELTTQEARTVTIGMPEGRGFQAWFRDGKPHRDDFPAVVHTDGRKFWFQNGVYPASSPGVDGLYCRSLM